MNATVEDLRPTIIPKSDQLNAEQLLGGPMMLTVTDVRIGSGEEQPVVVHYEGEAGRPYKPCKTMRKVLIHAWGPNGRGWIGKSLQVYNDPAVKFGGEDVGGIRISHMSDIPSSLKVSLTSTRGKKAKYEIKPLQVDVGPRLADVLAAIEGATNKATMDAAKELAGRLKNADDVTAAQAAYRARVAALKAQAPSKTAPKPLAAWIAEVEGATDAETAGLSLDAARDALSADDYKALGKAYSAKWEAGA